MVPKDRGEGRPTSAVAYRPPQDDPDLRSDDERWSAHSSARRVSPLSALREIISAMEARLNALEEQNHALHEALAGMAMRMTDVLSSVGAAYLRTDAHGDICDVSDTCAILLGLPQKDVLLGTALASVLSSQALDDCPEPSTRGTVCGASIRAQDGEEVPASVMFGAIPAPSGAATLGLVVVGAPMRTIAERVLQSAEVIGRQQVQVDDLRSAIRTLAEQVVGERFRTQELVRSNVEQVLMPLVRSLRPRADRDATTALDALERGLGQLGSGFANRLAAGGFGLTTRELEICHMLREGMSSKEIAQALSLSPQSVDVHRRNIRRKLNLTNDAQTLVDKLRSLDVEDAGTPPTSEDAPKPAGVKPK